MREIIKPNGPFSQANCPFSGQIPFISPCLLALNPYKSPSNPITFYKFHYTDIPHRPCVNGCITSHSILIFSWLWYFSAGYRRQHHLALQVAERSSPLFLRENWSRSRDGNVPKIRDIMGTTSEYHDVYI